MDIKELDEVNEALEMLKELGLPIGLEQLGRRKELEIKYIKETVIPLIQSRIQAMVEQTHEPFSLLVEYKRGTPVQVTLVDGKEIAIKRNSQTVTKKQEINLDVYSSDYLQKEWENYLNNLPGGKDFYRIYKRQTFATFSKLIGLMQSPVARKYTSFLLERLNLHTYEKISPVQILNALEPEQLVVEETENGISRQIILWSKHPKTQTLMDGTKTKVFRSDGVTPIMIDTRRKIKEGQWSLKLICDLIAQKEYFAKLRKTE